jgi:hypothetical protein
VYVVFKPGWLIDGDDSLSVAVTHGSPWRYDIYFPVVFAGYGLEAQTVKRSVRPVDIAITLSNVVGALPPSGAAGDVLIEVVEDKPEE